MVRLTISGDHMIVDSFYDVDNFDSILMESDEYGWRNQQVYIMLALQHGRNVTLKMEIPKGW